MFVKKVSIFLIIVMLLSFCGCSATDTSSDYSIVVYEDVVINKDTDTDNDTEDTSSKGSSPGKVTDTDSEESSSKSSSNDTLNNSSVNNSSDTSSDYSSKGTSTNKGDDFLTTYRIKEYKEKNSKLEAKVSQYQICIKKLGKSYSELNYPKFSGTTSAEELTWITDYNKKLNDYCTEIRNLLIKYGRESVKYGVNGDVSKAYEWAKYAFDKSDNLIALTYDDAPNEVTPALLDGLKERNVSAVFFLIGKQINSGNENQIKRMIDEGHIVGNHSMTHTPLYHKYKNMKVNIGETNESGIPLDPTSDVIELSQILEQKFGYNDFLLRVPGLIYSKTNATYASNGKYDAKTLSTNNYLVLVDTNTNFNDADGSRPWKDIYNDLLNVKPGSIVLMHAKTPSVDASLKYIDDMKPQGYTFVTVPELLMVYNGKIDLGVAYKSYDSYANLP